MLIHRISLQDGVVVLDASGRAVAAHCPACGTPSAQVHDRYQRRPLDLPWRGRTVRLHLTARRFRCANPACEKATFAEDFQPVLPRYARRTTETAALLLQIARTTGGEAGARLAQDIGIPTSADTLLRLLRKVPDPASTKVRVLGIDDLALRRGQTYATIFINLETHRPVDLLPGRTAGVVAEWLKAHPGVEIVNRDRAEAYAAGIRTGAPNAIQVADRFHLLQNASAALAEVLRSRRRHVDFTTVAASPSTAAPPTARARPLSPTRRQQADRRAARTARWERVGQLHRKGNNISQIAREVGIARRTVRRLLAHREPPRNQQVCPRPGGLSSPTLQPYVS